VANIVIKNPDEPATIKQLYRLHQLTGEDTRNWAITMGEASDRIAQLEGAFARPQTIITKSAPFTEAHVTIIEGPQRSGKTNTAVARVKDGYFNDCVRVYCEEVLKINCKVISYDNRTRLAKIKYKGVKKLLRIPADYHLHSPRRIFANIHLYGLPFVYCPSFAQTMVWLKSGKLHDGWLILDEAHVGMNARAVMSRLGQELEKQSFQFGKMQLDVIIITHMPKLIDWTLRTIPTEHIMCSYNKKTRKITLTSRKKGQQGTREVTYDATRYWPNYWTNERVVA